MRRRKQITFTRVEDATETLVDEPTPSTEPDKVVVRKPSVVRKPRVVLEPAPVPVPLNLPASWPYRDMMVMELYEFLNKHRPETWGSALSFIHELERSDQFDELRKITGETVEDRSRFMVELLWHISTYGPKEKIVYV